MLSNAPLEPHENLFTRVYSPSGCCLNHLRYMDALEKRTACALDSSDAYASGCAYCAACSGSLWYRLHQLLVQAIPSGQSTFGCSNLHDRRSQLIPCAHCTVDGPCISLQTSPSSLTQCWPSAHCTVDGSCFSRHPQSSQCWPSSHHSSRSDSSECML